MLDWLRYIDVSGVRWMLDVAATSGATEQIVYAVAQGAILGSFAVLWLMWRMPQPARAHHSAKKAVVLALLATVFVVAVKTLVAVVWVRSRPFITHEDIQALTFGLDPQSFPSGHAMVSMVLAISVYMSGFKKFGAVLLVLAVLTGLGRVGIGVHYPSDVIGGWIVAYGVSLFLHRETSSIKRYLPNS